MQAKVDVKSWRVGPRIALGECLSVHARPPLLADELGRGRGRHDEGRGLVQPQLRLREPPRRTVHGRSAHERRDLLARARALVGPQARAHVQVALAKAKAQAQAQPERCGGRRDGTRRCLRLLDGTRVGEDTLRTQHAVGVGQCSADRSALLRQLLVVTAAVVHPSQPSPSERRRDCVRPRAAAGCALASAWSGSRQRVRVLRCGSVRAQT